MSKNSGWNLCPVIGQINDGGVVCVFSNKYRVTLRVSKANPKSASPSVLVPSDWEDTNVLVFRGEYEAGKIWRIWCPLDEVGHYIFEWVMEDYSDKFKIAENNHRTVVPFGVPIKKLIFMSCDHVEADVEERESMWNIMRKDIGDESVALVHIGDQVYMDRVWKKFLSGKKKATEEERLSLMRDSVARYMKTWEGHADILGSCCNMMVLDDHEIINDFVPNKRLLESPAGVVFPNEISMSSWEEPFEEREYWEFPTDITDPTRREIMEMVAMECYMNIQQGLHTKIPDTLSWCKVFESMDVALICVERVYHKEDIDKIIDAMNRSEKGSVVLCFAGFPFSKPDGLLGSLYERMFSGDKFWDRDFTTQLYTRLLDWLEENKMRRLIVIGGDAHMGYLGNVSRNYSDFYIACASPITNQPTLDRTILSKAMKGEHRFDGDIRLVTVHSEPLRCYVELDISTLFWIPRIVFCKNKVAKSTINYMGSILAMGKANALAKLKE